MKYLLGIDIGTTGTKAILFSQDGPIVNKAYRGYPISTPGVGFCEQDPRDWWAALCDTVKEVTADPSIRENVVAMALSTQGGTTIGVDEKGKAVRPAFVWNDCRCTEELEEFKHELPDLDVYRFSGWHATAAMPALQCRWLKKQETENYQKIRRFLSVPDYLSLKLTGRAAIDRSNAGINRFADLQNAKYDERLLGFAGLMEDQLPEILPSGAVIGTLTEKAAAELGLPANVELISGAHDQYAAALGAGALKSGDILVGTGTSFVVTAVTGKPAFDTGFPVSVSAAPGLYGCLRSLSSGGVCLDWLRENLTGENGSPLPYSVIDQETERLNAAKDDLFFFPFSGLCGDKKRFSKASFTGLDLSHNKYHLARAVMESAAFQIRWMIEAFPEKPGKDGFVLAGGASKSPTWTRIIADVMGMPVRVPEDPDLACVGAAILAGTGCGIYQDVAEGYKTLGVKTRTVMPDPAAQKAYDQYYARYQQIAVSLGKII